MSELYLIRADGNSAIGAGHLMRCLTIADSLREKLAAEDKILFVCAGEESAGPVRDAGFETVILGTDYRDMEAELPVLEQFLEEIRKTGTIRWILADSYFVTWQYLHTLQNYGKVALLDDMAREAYPVDLIINYNLYASEEHYRTLYGNADVRFALGAAYVPLRKQFVNRVRKTGNCVKSVLITTGGADKDNIGGTIMEHLSQEYPAIRFQLVAGRYHPKLEKLLQWENSHENVTIHSNVKDMAGLMEQNDVCITAGGTTLYEASAMGIPLICFSYAENQEQLVNFIGTEKIACCGGAWHLQEKETFQRICDMFAELCESENLRKQCRERETGLVDGAGAGRIAELLFHVS